MKDLKMKIGLIFLLIIASLLLLRTSTVAQEKKLISEKSFEVKSGESLYVETSGADVKVVSWDKNEALIKIFGNKKAENEIYFEIEKVEDGIKVIAKKKKRLLFDFGVALNLRIDAYVPKYYNCEINTSGGDIRLNDIQGEHKLNTSGGDIELEKLSGNIKAKTSGGDIKLKNVTGKLDVSTSGGDINCKDVVGELYASTSGGDIVVDYISGMIEAFTSGGDIKITIQDEFKGLQAKTTGGDIFINLPAFAKASVELETTGGEIECDFSNSKTYKVTRKKLLAEFNGGGNKLRAYTTGGDIILKEK